MKRKSDKVKLDKTKCLHKNWEIKSSTFLCNVDCLDCHKSVPFGEIFGDKPYITSEIFEKIKKL